MPVSEFETIKFWELHRLKFSELYRVFKVLSSIFPSNADIERLFSKIKGYKYWKRNRLGKKNILNRILLNENN